MDVEDFAQRLREALNKLLEEREREREQLAAMEDLVRRMDEAIVSNGNEAINPNDKPLVAK